MVSQQSLHIAILVPSLHGGGAEFVASQWGKYLSTRGDEVTFLTTHDSQAAGSRHVGGSWFGERLLSLRSMLKASGFDVVLSLAPHWNLLAILARIGLRKGPAIVISGRTIEIEANRAGNNKSIELSLARMLYRKADQYIAISHATAAEAQAIFGIGASRIWVVPNPALGKVDWAEITRRLIAVESGGEDTASSVLELVVPGRLTPSKRSRLAIDVAIECAKKSSRQVRLHFFGSGASESDARSRASPGVEILFHGWVEHWFEEVPSNAVVLLTSKVEGFANVLIESTAMGFPTVASSRALGVSDAIVPGVSGQLTLTDSAAEYARAVFEAEELKVTEALLPWLQRFTVESSGSKMREVLSYAVQHRDYK